MKHNLSVMHFCKRLGRIHGRGRSQDLPPAQCWKVFSRLALGLQRLFLRSPAELPKTQGCCQSHSQNSGECKQPETGTPGSYRSNSHRIIRYMKYLVIVAFVAIIGSLAAALVFMMRSPQNNAESDEKKSRRMARALALRVGFSVLLFVLVLISYFAGWIQPTGLPLR